MFGITKMTHLTLAILLVNEIEALFGLEALLRGTSFKDYPVYWNVPTFMCHKYDMYFEEVSRNFSIIQNPHDEFRGNEIVMLYDPGMFPALLKSPNGSVVMRNGGVPQEGNLAKHLKLFKEHVVEHIPDVKFRGLGIIDFESWRPIYRQNWASLAPYRDLSEKIVKREHPNWSEGSRKRKAIEDFEKWGRLFMNETLRIARATRPDAIWGYYAYPYCFNNTPKQNNSNCDPKVLEENDSMSWLFKAENVMLPSVYLRTSLSEKQKIGLIKGRITEAMRISRKIRPRTKVLAYFWYKYQDQRDVFLSRIDTVNGIREIIDQGADGYVIWGSSYDLNSREKCQNFRDYLNVVLGPAIVESKIMANQRVSVDQELNDNEIKFSHEDESESHDKESQSRPLAISVP